MAKIVVEYVGGDAEMCRRRRGADQCRHRRHQVGEMIGHRQRAVTQILDLAGLLRPLGSRSGGPNAHAEPERLAFR